MCLCVVCCIFATVTERFSRRNITLSAKVQFDMVMKFHSGWGGDAFTKWHTTETKAPLICELPLKMNAAEM